jgi:hypothetical protein
VDFLADAREGAAVRWLPLSADLAVLQDARPTEALSEGVASARRVADRAPLPVGDDRGAGAAVAGADETSHQITARLTGAGPRDGAAGLAQAATETGGAREVLLATRAHRAGELAGCPHAGGRGRAETPRCASLTCNGQRGARRRVVAVEARGAQQSLSVALRSCHAIHDGHARRCGQLMITYGPRWARYRAWLSELSDRQTRGPTRVRRDTWRPPLTGNHGLEARAALTLKVLVARLTSRQRSGDVADCRDRTRGAARALDRAGARFQRVVSETAAGKREAALADLLEAPAQTSDLAGGQRGPGAARAVVERVEVVPARARRRCRWRAAARLARGHGEHTHPHRAKGRSKHARCNASAPHLRCAQRSRLSIQRRRARSSD